jgi:hypothetical protein
MHHQSPYNIACIEQSCYESLDVHSTTFLFLNVYYTLHFKQSVSCLIIEDSCLYEM